MKDYKFEWNYFEPRHMFSLPFFSRGIRLHNSGGFSIIVCDKDGGNIRILSTETDFK